MSLSDKQPKRKRDDIGKDLNVSVYSSYSQLQGTHRDDEREKIDKVSRQNKEGVNDVIFINPDDACIRDIGNNESIWSKPVELGCCCACHESEGNKCSWCNASTCNVVLAKVNSTKG
mmetsp:Transcript_16485/g.23439  ORF Transcript_16485/g.23439 Transcript_16485/m.23439 type:complete len:117 (-) Transcript_16485:460-810(-)